MKERHNKFIIACFLFIVIAGIGTKAVMKLSDVWATHSAEQARLDAEAEVRQKQIELAKAEAESKQKMTKATVLKLAEEYDAQRTALGAFKRPGDGYKFTLPDKDAYGTPILLLYSRGSIVDSFKVRSAGFDKTYYTEDDFFEERWSANGAGAVDGVKSSAGELLQGAKDKIFGGKKDK